MIISIEFSGEIVTLTQDTFVFSRAVEAGEAFYCFRPAASLHTNLT